MDIVTAAYAANKAKTDLANSGQIGYVEFVKGDVIVPEITFTAYHAFEEELERLRVGETYYVLWDGVEYSCVCVTKQSGKNIYVGFGAGGNIDTGIPDDGVACEPFLYRENWRESNFRGQNISAFDSGTHTVSIYQKKEVFRPIDPKYIPGYIPTVEIADTLAITDEENAALSDCIGRPIVVNEKNNNLSTFYSYALIGGKHCFLSHMYTSDGYGYGSTDGKTWTFGKML